jgi:hypothetical protein
MQVSVAVLLDNFLSASNQIAKDEGDAHYLEKKESSLVSKTEVPFCCTLFSKAVFLHILFLSFYDFLMLLSLQRI